MYNQLTISDNYVTFGALAEIVDFSILRLRIDPEYSQPGYATPGIVYLHFMVVDNTKTPKESGVVYSIRATDSCELKITEFDRAGISEQRPDGTNWIEPHDGALTGNPDYQYYDISAFEKVFSANFFHRHAEEGEYFITLVMFSKDDLQEYNIMGKKHHRVYYKMNPWEVNELSRREDMLAALATDDDESLPY